jgi:hypothetical protein
MPGSAQTIVAHQANGFSLVHEQLDCRLSRTASKTTRKLMPGYRFRPAGSADAAAIGGSNAIPNGLALGGANRMPDYLILTS